MDKKLLTLTVAMLLSASAFADSFVEGTATNDASTSEFVSEERTDEGFLTHYLNNAIAAGMEKVDEKTKVEYGRKVTDYVSAPKFGGYFIGKYAYSSQEGKNTGDGFSQRLVRFYVDGTILKDFAYRIQIQTNNSSFHMKDFFLEWRKYPEFKVKIGQYKRAFGLENPMNPWDVGVGDYSQLTKKLTGHSDFIGVESSSNGGRDQGLQVQGDLFPIGKDGHRLIHYQLMVSNGQGINSADANAQKDVTGTIQFQPIQGLYIGAYGWTGNFTYNNTTVRRERYDIIAKYEKNDWSFRGEYAHSTGPQILSQTYYTTKAVTDADGNKVNMTEKQTAYYAGGSDRADAWYATLGIPCTKWLKTYLKYDVYRSDATWSTTKSIYSVCPNINLHKNLMFQPQFNYVHDRTLSGRQDYCELWVETYVRF